ncbi:MAG: VCBS repeat-containing protein [Candidatus Midichloria sp.]|nr:VCBS repeat-containing protein [Candidatus Midichloria sp.]
MTEYFKPQHYMEPVAVGDFNRDGKTDIASTNYILNNVTILLGNGDGKLLSLLCFL